MASALGKPPHQGREMSSLIGCLAPHVSRVKAGLAFTESLCAYQLSGQKLAFMAFYLATSAPSWPVLKHWLATAFFLQHTEAVVGEDRTLSSRP